jgi:hypothetical protein
LAPVALYTWLALRRRKAARQRAGDMAPRDRARDAQ